MAYQPKSYKKFVATAATATLVATAIVPVASAADAKSFKDVSKTYQEAVNYLVTNDIAQGKSDTMFGTSATITRGDAAVMIAKAMKLDTAKAPSAGFTDVNARVGGSVNALVAAGVVSGKTAKTFAPDANITRQEMAKIITNAYKLEAGSTKNSFKDVNSNWDGFVDALLANGVTVGKTPTTFAATSAVTRGEFALFVFRSENLAPATPSVVSVSATNPSTLTLTGTGLKNLKAADVTVASNDVLSLVASADGKSATVTLAGKLAPSTDTAVTVKQGEETKSFSVKYEIKVTSVQVNAGTFDDERANQKVTFKVNGETVNADPEYLALAGYSVNYVVKDGTALFANTPAATNTSTTGILAAGPLAIDDYEVEVQLIKSGEALVSGTQTIKIRNIDGATTNVAAARFINGGSNNAVATVAGASTIAATDFAMNSTSLVAGEVALVDNVKATIAGEETTLVAADSITSSNPAVISVVSATSTLKAESAGTAVITVKVGDVTKTYNFTVTNSARVLTKAVPKTSSVKLVSGVGSTLNVKTLDQYGDPISVATAGIAENVPTNANGAALITSAVDVVTADNGSVDLTLTGEALANAGSGTLFFKKGNTVIGSVLVTLSATNNVDPTKAKLEVTAASESADATLDLLNADDNTVEYQLSEYTSEGLYVGAANIATHTVTSADTTIATVSAIAANKFTVTAVKAGSTDIVLKDVNGAHVRTVKVTVTEDAYGLKTVTLKTPTTVTNIGQVLKASSALTLTSSTLDDIVEGVALTKATQSKVRIAETAQTATDLYLGATTSLVQGDLYLDLDNSATYSNGDVKLGTVLASFTADSNSILTTGATPATPYAGVQTTASGAKGTLIFKIMTDSSDQTTSIAATSIAVDVK